MEVIKLFDIPKEIINDNERQRRVYSSDGISPTILGRSDNSKIMEVKVIAQMDNTIDHTFESANRVYDVGGISPTINTCGGGGLQPKIIDEPKCLNSKGGRNGIDGLQPSLQDRVYDTNGVSVAVTTSFMPGILEDKTIVAMRGRNPDNPSDRTVGTPTKQRLEPNSQGICNTLTSVQKDNLVMEKMCISTKGKENNVASTILAGYERTNMTGFNADNGVIEKVGQIEGSFEQSGRVYNSKGIAPTIMSNSHGNTTGGYTPHKIAVAEAFRIRKLTPRECWRLMGFKDEDFEKAAQVNSNTQLYRQAGNSICKNMLVAILGQMIPGKEDVYKKLETR